jgi:tetratricopeptide (TPR) repeat protein
MLTGEPGIGKTRLLDEAVRHAAVAGWSVLRGGCTRSGGQLPYAPLLQALQHYARRCSAAQMGRDLRGCAWLVKLLPELAEGPIEPLPGWALSPDQERRLLFVAVGRLLANVAGPAGTLLVLDDLQWAGADALDLLHTLVRDAGTQLRVVGAYRDTEIAPHGPLAALLADMAHAGMAQRQNLDPLPPEASEALVEALLEGDRALATRVVRRAGGVPFFLVSCVQELRRGGDSLAEEAVPWEVTQSIRHRLAMLPASTQQVLGVAALAGRVLRQDLLRGVTGLPEFQVMEALDAAYEARLVLEAGGAYQFAHDLIREVVEREVRPGLRQILHRQIAEALEHAAAAAGTERPVTALVYHYRRSDAPVKALPYLEQAGIRAQAQAAHAAAEYYAELLELLDGLERTLDAARIRERLGAVLRTTGQYTRALAVLEQSAAAFEAAGDLESLARITAQIGYVRYDQGVPAEVARLQALVATMEARGPSHGLAMLHDALTHVYYLQGRFREHLAAATRTAEVARLVGDMEMLAQARASAGGALINMGRDDEALPALEEAYRLAEASGALGALNFAAALLSVLHEERGDFGAARPYVARALAVGEQLENAVMRMQAEIRLGALAFFSGDWTQAREHFEHVPRPTELSALWRAPLLELGRLALAEGKWEEAAAYLTECSSMAGRVAHPLIDRVAESLLAELDLLEGRPQAALARLLPLLDRHGMEERVVTMWLLPVLAWAYLELGDTEQASDVIGGALRRQRAAQYRLGMVGALRVQALIAMRQAQVGEAKRALDEGLALARPMPYPYGEARLLQVYALLHARLGEPEGARDRLDEAHAIFRRLGARNDIEWAEQLLSALD